MPLSVRTGNRPEAHWQLRARYIQRFLVWKFWSLKVVRERDINLRRLLLGGNSEGTTEWSSPLQTDESAPGCQGHGTEANDREASAWAVVRNKAETLASPLVWKQNLQPNYSDKNAQNNSKGGICVWTDAKRKTDLRLPTVSRALLVDSRIILSLWGKISKSTLNSSSEIHTLGCCVFSVKYFWGTCQQDEGATVI